MYDGAQIATCGARRPLTVLCFRQLAAAARALFPPPPRPGPDKALWMKDPVSFSSVPFHVANVALHCLVTCLVFR